MKLIQSLCSMLLLLLATACSSGGGSGGSDGRGYSLTLSQNQVTVDVAYNGSEVFGPVAVEVDFVGDGLVVGYPHGAQEEPSLFVDIVLQSSNRATLLLSFAQNSYFEQPGTYTRTLRVLTGSASGDDFVYKDIRVDLRQLDGIDVAFAGDVSDAQTSSSTLQIYSSTLSWQVSTETPWIVLEQTSGMGSAEVSYSFDFTQAAVGLNSGSIEVTATAAEGRVFRRSVPVSLNNNIALISDTQSLHGEWGGPLEQTQLQIITALPDWTLSSTRPGVSFEPASGSGSATVTVSYDSRPMGVGYHELPLLASVSDLTASASVYADVGAPSVVGDSYNNTRQVYFAMDVNGVDAAETLSFALSNGAETTWQVSELPTWLSVNKVTGSTSELLSIEPNDNMVTEGRSQADFVVTVNIPGAPVTFIVTAAVDAEFLRLDPVVYSYAFSDYGLSTAKTGNIQFRRIIGLSEPNLQTPLVAESGAAWLTVTSANLGGVQFDLQTDDLAEGFHWTSLSLEPAHPRMLPAVVSVGYYKSGSSASFSAGADGSMWYQGVRDPLGPWLYFTKENENQVYVFNTHTGAFEAPINFPTASSITQLQMSDDGRRLIAKDYLQSRVYFYDLRGQQAAGYWSDVYTSYDMRFLRIHGQPLLFTEPFWSRLEEQASVQSTHSDEFRTAFLTPAGNGVLSASASECGVNYLPIDYSYVNNRLTFGEAVPALGGCSTIGFAASADGRLLAAYDSFSNTIRSYIIEADGSLTVQASASLAAGWSAANLAITQKGLVIAAVSDANGDAIHIYNADMSAHNTVSVAADRRVSVTAGIRLSSDDKVGVYVDASFNYDAAKVVSFPVTAP